MQSTVRTAVLRILYSYVRPYSIVILTQLLQYRILSTAVLYYRINVPRQELDSAVFSLSERGVSQQLPNSCFADFGDFVKLRRF